MTIKIILYITLTILFIYIYIIYNVENMTDAPTKEIDKQYIDIIKQIYLVDVEAIRNLSAVASNLLTANKLTIPGKLIVDGELRFTNCFTSENICVGANTQINQDVNTKVNICTGAIAQIKQNGDIEGNKLNLKGSISNTGNVTITKGSIIVSSDNDKGNQLQLINTLKTGNGNNGKWIISNMKSDNINNNKLSFTCIKENIEKSALDLCDNGDVNIPSNLTVNNLLVNNILTKRNKARFIRVGNIRTNLNSRETGVINDSEQLIALNDYWSLIEIRAFDHKGKNVCDRKSVTKILGDPLNSNYQYQYITNNMINKTINDQSNDNISYGYHGGRGQHLLQIDLEDDHDISHIELYNRYYFDKDETNGSPTYDVAVTSRMNGTIVELISGKDMNQIIIPDIINRRIHTGLWDRIYSKIFIL